MEENLELECIGKKGKFSVACVYMVVYRDPVHMNVLHGNCYYLHSPSEFTFALTTAANTGESQ